MRKRLWCLLLAVCLVASCMGCGCRKKSTGDGLGGGFRFPIDAEPAMLDPQMAQDDPSVTVLCALFEGLTRLDNNGTAVPAAADWTVSADGLTYTFTLRESYWCVNSLEEGTQPWDEAIPVTADDFIFAMQRLADPATGSPLAAELVGIQNAEGVMKGDLPLEELGVKAVDDSHLTITLETPDNDFPARLATSPFFPCHREFFKHTAGRYGLEEEYVLSNGAFRLAAWNHDESLLLYKYANYHEAADIAPEAVRFVIGVEDPVTALQEGDLAAAPLSAAQAAEIEGIRTTQLDDTLRSLWLNTDNTLLSEVKVRQALRESIQWSSIQSFLDKSGEAVATGFVPPAATVDGKVYRATTNALSPTTDVTAAVAHLQEGLDALNQEGTVVSTVRLEVLAADDTVSTDIARYIVQSWQKNLGVTVTLTLIGEQELAKRVKNGNYQVALYTHTPSGLTGSENLSCFASTAPDNWARLADGGIDAAITAATQGGRTELEALEQALWEACPTIPISFPCRYYGFAENTADIVARPFGGGRYQSPLDFRSAKMYG